jgi:hypothetical protein
MIKDIKIIGGVHNRGDFAPHDLPEEKIEAMVAELAGVIGKYTRMDSWITVEMVKIVGGKINS